MSASDRQSRLLVAEDWKRIYQSFRNADFQSYDFDNLRRTMINYLRQNYPEDFKPEDSFQVLVSGKKYNISNNSEYEQAMDYINTLLKTKPITKEPEPGEEPAAAGGETPPEGEAPAEETPPEEETPEPEA
jgi:hypothetical protein